jgi:hypothetical protein
MAGRRTRNRIVTPVHPSSLCPTPLPPQSLAASEEALYSLRLQLRDHRHSPQAWLADARAGAPRASLPPDWDDSVFGADSFGGNSAAVGATSVGANFLGGKSVGANSFGGNSAGGNDVGGNSFGANSLIGGNSAGDNPAWDLLCAMLALDPAARPDAASILVGPYLNQDCATADAVPLPAPKPWSYEALLRAVGVGHGFAVPEECLLRDREDGEAEAARAARSYLNRGVGRG